jgi:hypothetical protein
MAENKKSFILYADLIHMVDKLPDDKAGELFKLILNYVNDNNPDTDDVLLQVAFEPIKRQLKRDLTHWESIREKRREAGKKGGKQKVANASKRVANQAVNVNVNDNVNVINKKGRTPFKQPTEQEVLNYFTDNGYTEEAGRNAFKYYDEADWHDSRGNKVKSWKQKMRAIWFKEEHKQQPIKYEKPKTTFI